MIVSWNVVDDEQYSKYGGVIYPKSLGSDVMLHCFNTTDIDEVEGLIKKYREKQNVLILGSCLDDVGIFILIIVESLRGPAWIQHGNR